MSKHIPHLLQSDTYDDSTKTLPGRDELALSIVTRLLMDEGLIRKTLAALFFVPKGSTTTTRLLFKTR